MTYNIDIISVVILKFSHASHKKFRIKNKLRVVDFAL